MKKLMYLLIIVINLLLNINLSAQESMLIAHFDSEGNYDNIPTVQNRAVEYSYSIWRRGRRGYDRFCSFCVSERIPRKDNARL